MFLPVVVLSLVSYSEIMTPKKSVSFVNLPCRSNWIKNVILLVNSWFWYISSIYLLLFLNAHKYILIHGDVLTFFSCEKPNDILVFYIFSPSFSSNKVTSIPFLQNRFCSFSYYLVWWKLKLVADTVWVLSQESKLTSFFSLEKLLLVICMWRSRMVLWLIHTFLQRHS